MQLTTPQPGSKMQQTTPSMSGTNHYNNPDMANNAQSSTAWGRMSRADVQRIQQKLQQDGLYRGKIDGLVGLETQRALRVYQRENGWPVTATFDPQTLNSLDSTSAGVGSSSPPNSSNDTNMTPSSNAGKNNSQTIHH